MHRSVWIAAEIRWCDCHAPTHELHTNSLIARRYLGGPLTNNLMNRWSMGGVSQSDDFYYRSGPRSLRHAA